MGSSHLKVFCKKCVLRNFAKFTGKDLCQSLFFNKVAGLIPKVSLHWTRHRNSHQGCSVRKGVFRNFETFTGKHSCARVSFLIKLQPSASNFIKKDTLAQVFSSEFCEVSKNTFFTEHLRATASEDKFSVQNQH